MAQVIAPKILGTIHLDSATINENLDFCILFSSIAAVFSNMGQSDYAFSNGFMDNFALMRESMRQNKLRGGKTISINWPLWKSGGMKTIGQMGIMVEKATGMVSMATLTGLAAFQFSLSIKGHQLIVIEGYPEKVRKTVLGQTKGVKKKQTVNTKVEDETLIDNEFLSTFLNDLMTIVSDISNIEIDNIDSSLDFKDYGFDSILTIEFMNKLNNKFNIEITPDLFEYHDELTIQNLAEQFFELFKSDIKKYYGGKEIITGSSAPAQDVISKDDISKIDNVYKNDSDILYDRLESCPDEKKEIKPVLSEINDGDDLTVEQETEVDVKAPKQNSTMEINPPDRDDPKAEQETEVEVEEPKQNSTMETNSRYEIMMRPPIVNFTQRILDNGNKKIYTFFKRLLKQFAKPNPNIPSKVPKTIAVNQFQEDVPVKNVSGKNDKVLSENTQKDLNLVEKYKKFCRPELVKKLQDLCIDKSFHKAEKNSIFYYDDDGNEIELLDFLGGYGASLLGHNHPELVKTYISNVEKKIPFNAQASCRKYAALLGEKLDNILFERTRKNFITTFANTGTEAVEAAIKHAEFSQAKRIMDLDEDIEKWVDELIYRYKNDEITFLPEFKEVIQEKVGLSSETDIFSMLTSLRPYNFHSLSAPPLFLCLKGSFHGKTVGSVQLTYNDIFRKPFYRIPLNVKFFEPEDYTTLEEEIEDATIKYLWPEINDMGEVTLAERKHVNVPAVFVEPIQGEGGIYVISKKFMHHCRALTKKHHIALILDEIQCGMGRTGTFLFSEQQEVVGDYYLLSKSLGGGLSKISALTIERSVYEDDFGLIHSSTFAEDDHSARIAMKVLDIVCGDGTLMNHCAQMGAYLISGLRLIQNEYPDVIKEVRGVGLMLGIEFHKQKMNGSEFLRNYSEKKTLEYIICAYLFHEHKIRVLSTMSKNIMRLEPSAYIKKEDCDRFIFGLKRAAEIIHKQNIYELTKFLIGAGTPGTYKEVNNCRQTYMPYKKTREVKKIAFIAHVAEVRQIENREKGFAFFSDEQIEMYIDKVFTRAEPDVSDRITVQSITGKEVSLNFIGLMIDSRLFGKYMKEGNYKILQEEVNKAVDVAIDEGCSIIGFGGYTSIVTQNCKSVKTHKAGITTGNSLTVGMGVEALYRASKELEINLEDSCFAGIGAGGNICSVYCEIISEKIPKIFLIGRSGRGLDQTAARIYKNAFQNILKYRNRADFNEQFTLEGVAKEIYETETVRKMLEKYKPGMGNIGSVLIEGLNNELKDSVPVIMTKEYSCLKQSNLIVGSSNSVKPVIFPEMLGQGPIVVCDLAVPTDVDESVSKSRKDIMVIKGGNVRLPNPDFKINGFPLKPGNSYACMAETIVLGLCGITESYSVGEITKEQVDNIMNYAKYHGLCLGDYKVRETF